MKAYIVGGYVRDLLLGRIPKDKDWVFVGCESELRKVIGDAQQVGKSFRVWIKNGEQYTIADNLFDDLMRRDLTINAVALDPDTGVMFMAPHALEDFKNGVLRHLPRFADDPLRVYRVARFAAELGFSIAPETLELIKSLKSSLRHLAPERVCMELEKALKSPAPWRFFEVLREAGVLDVHFREVAALVGVPAGKHKHRDERDAFDHSMRVLQLVSKWTESPITRFAALCHDLGKGRTNPQKWPAHHDHDKLGVDAVRDLCSRLRLPSAYYKAGRLAALLHMDLHRLFEMRPGRAVKKLTTARKFPGGLHELLLVIKADGVVFDISVVEQIVEEVFAVRLPEKYRGLGRKSGEILHQLRAEKWRELVRELNRKEKCPR